MKKIRLTLICILLQTLNLVADVKFDFTYADLPGKGFHARPEAKVALEEVASTIGSHWLKHHNANIKIKVTSEEDIKQSDSFKVAFSDNSLTGILYSSQEKILFAMPEENRSVIFDGHIHINFTYPFGFNDKINENEFDFKALMIQKITQILGFGSLNVFNEQLMNNIKEELISRLFVYGYNEIKGIIQEIKIDTIINTLNFFDGQNIDIERYVRAKSGSVIGKVYAELIIRFKNAIINDTFNAHENLLNELSNELIKYELTIEDIMAFKFENLEALILNMMKLSAEKLSGKPSKLINEKEVRKQFFSFYILNENYAFSRFQDIIACISSEKTIRESFESILEFIFEYFEDETLHNENKISLYKDLVDNVLDNNGIQNSYEELVELFETLLDTFHVKYSIFDKFLAYKNGEKVFGRRKTLKILLSDFNEHIQESHLYFKGPYTLQYLNAPIKLQKKIFTFVADENSVMSSFYDKKGLRSRRWDQSVTAILLDLGYNVNNRWTRLWKNQSRDEERLLLQQNINEFVKGIFNNIKKDVKKKFNNAKNKAKKKTKKAKEKFKDLF